MKKAILFLVMLFYPLSVLGASLTISFSKNNTIVDLVDIDNISFDIQYSFPIFVLKLNPPLSNLQKPIIPDQCVIKDIEIRKTDEKIDTIIIKLKRDVQYLATKKQNRLSILFTEIDNKNLLRELKFVKDSENNLIIKLYMNKKATYSLKSSKNRTLDILLNDTAIPKNLIKIYDLSQFNSIVIKMFLQNSIEGGVVRLFFKKREPINIEQKNKLLIIKIPYYNESIQNISVAQNKVTQSTNNTPKTLGSSNYLLPGMKQCYSGKKISIDLQNADVKHVLRLLAKVGGYNIIFDDQVSGSITLKLENVPWDQILDLVLTQKGLGKVVKGNIMRIAPLQKIQQEQEQAKRLMQQRQEVEPLYTKYIKVNYAKASEMAAQLEKFKGRRGTITYDIRTNQLIISDTIDNINRIEQVLKKLDQPEKQVLIEARVVYATESFQRGLGLNWGGNLNTGASYGGEKFDIGLPSQFAVNLPTSPTVLNFGGYISKLTGSTLFTLDAQLTLGESKGEVTTVSSPRIITLNNQQAKIVQGTKIATKTESESGGTTTEYKDAVLKLSVTPQITPDKNLILELEVSDDSPVGGGENIETKSAKTKLMVKDGETIVIGGVQRVSENKKQDRVPFLAKLPIIGNAFKNNYKSKERRELLIFIRPKILE